jgi:hypothetical protein
MFLIYLEAMSTSVSCGEMSPYIVFGEKLVAVGPGIHETCRGFIFVVIQRRADERKVDAVALNIAKIRSDYTTVTIITLTDSPRCRRIDLSQNMARQAEASEARRGKVFSEDASRMNTASR